MRKKLGALLAAATFGVMPLLAGCQVAGKVLPKDTPERAETVVADEDAVYLPEGSAAYNEAYFARIAKEYAEAGQEFSSESIVKAFVAAGFEKANMQVSFDRTKIDLDVDALFLSVRFGDQCLIAQVGRENRDYVVNLAPALGVEKNRCLIGETKEITW